VSLMAALQILLTIFAPIHVNALPCSSDLAHNSCSHPC
jgi:hypothetical protein